MAEEDTKTQENKKQEKLKYARTWIERLNNQWQSINSDRQDALRFINNDPTIVQVVKGRSQLVTTDMQDAIDMAKPDILETIVGIDEPMKLDPSSNKDIEPIKRLQILGNIQLRRKNNWFRRCSDFLDDSMKLKFGVFKYQWVEKNETIQKHWRNLSEIELNDKVASGQRIVSDETDDEGVRKTVTEYDIYDEYVEISTPPAERVKFPLDSRSFKSAPFVFEEVRLYEEEYIELYGQDVFDRIKDIKDSLDKPEPDQVEQERYRDVGGLGFIYDKDESKYKSYECYFKDKETRKAWIFVFSGDEIIIDEYNKYDKAPYEGGSPFLVAHRLLSLGYFDYLKDIQMQRTVLKRQIFDNLSQANYRRYFGDPERLNMDDYLNNNSTNALIRVDGDPKTAIMAEEKAPLPPEVLSFWELMNVEKDYHLPTPRSFTGVGKTQQRSWRGQAQQVTLAQKKLLMMIRGYMEDVFAPLFDDVITCILKFMKHEVSLRYLNEDYMVSPDNIIGKYDMVVNVGLGAQDKNDMVMKLQQLIGLASKMMGTGIFTNQNLAYMSTELVKAMGFLNTTDFVTDPKVKPLMLNFIKIVTTMLEEMKKVPILQGVVMEISPIISEEIRALTMAMGIQMEEPKPVGGPNKAGTQPGEITPEISTQPHQPINPMLQEATAGNNGFMG